MREYFAILGLEPGASPRDIRLAFRRLARELHPDVAMAHGLSKEDAERRFREVRQAYETLLALPAGKSAAATDSPPPRAPARASESNASPWRRATPFEKPSAKGEDFEIGLAVSLEEVLLGGVRQVSYRLPGETAHRQVQVTVPKGALPEQILRLPKGGFPGRHGGRPGDLLLRVRYAPHAWFGVRESSLLAELAIHPALAVIGGVFTIPLLGGGEHQLPVPAGVQANQQYRVHGEGLPRAGQARGDLIITISIAIPTTYSMEERRLWEKLAKLAVEKE